MSPSTRGACRCAPRVARPPLGLAKKEHLPTVGQKQGVTGAKADGDEGVGGPHTSKEAGKWVAPKPAEQRRPVSRKSFRRET